MFDRLQVSDRQFNRLALSGILGGFVLLLVALAVTIASANGTERATGWVRHSSQVKAELDQLLLEVERTETATRGYLLAPDARRIQTRAANLALLRPSLLRLENLVADNPVQRNRLASLRDLIADQMATSNVVMRQAVSGDLDAARAEFIVHVKVRQIEQIRNLGANIYRAETALQDQRIAVEGKRRQQLQVVLGITGLLLLLLGAAAFALVRRYTADLTAARDRLNSLNTNLEAAVAERTVDLRRANDEIQRFAYIVSHDLRSPLVNVMGFTAELEAANAAVGALLERAETEAPQLVTADAKNAREDLPEAIGFIRSSTQKMDRLINAILTLSRQGRRVLNPEPLPMNAVIHEILATLTTQIEQKSIIVTVQDGLPSIHHDRLAIDQIFQNLIENATKYLRADVAGTIDITGRREGARAIFEIADNGRGVDPRDHERIFELFRRSGAQDQRGEGIGLAHVRALAYRLGGTVTIRSALNEGSTFIVNLPMTYHAEGREQ